ncbi:type I 3-dehydroquinate dehydratase [Vagococcus penaei]|uniref:3-dehydroquinate dehydratase n=1 Tax=Vagococcus penaei TaxID=633807 RepID=A0A1Q2D3G4_9ENTE|nr:type I 3-dehydroquinate dehydratase [Vagococcus penaei]AQP52914.1 type I 3-dehydroquinate dehydratase [Vagococcus penaei]RSU01447.1 type I 3-dehydroquinate dehydratase [Vagococcus penaei]
MSKLKVRNLTLGQGQPKVCVSLIASNFKELFAEATRLNRLDCDIIEWRADYFMYVNDMTFMRKAAYFIRYAIEDKPLIFTFRSHEEGGGQIIDDDYYLELNRLMIQTGLVDVIDIELDKVTKETKELITYAQMNNVRVLLSNHKFDTTPNKQSIKEMVNEMALSGADICKLAVTPSDLTDVLTILTASNELQIEQPSLNFILIGMGNTGKLTRMTGELFGSVITYAANGKVSSAPGQLSITEVKAAMDLIGDDEN